MRMPMYLLLPLLALGGCVINTAEREGLPTGVTLLETEEGYCDGPIEIDADPDVMIESGESTTIALDDGDGLDWACVGDSRDYDELDCPEGSAYVRITREEDAEEFSFECYGS
ncbi:MAG TPA: hypothetical protein VF210_11155 [Pseudomonadales bacterium]